MVNKEIQNKNWSIDDKSGTVLFSQIPRDGTQRNSKQELEYGRQVWYSSIICLKIFIVI